MNKKFLSILLAFVMVLGSTVSVLADPFDLIHNSDSLKNHTMIEFAKEPIVFKAVSKEIDSYLIEAEDGKLYKATEVDAALKAGAQNFIEAIKDLTPVDEQPTDELKVIKISAINAAQIEIEFNQEVDPATIVPANFYIGLTNNVTNAINVVASAGNAGDYDIDLLDDGKTVIISSNDLASRVIWEDENTAAATALKTDLGNVEKNRTVYVQMKDIRTKDGKLQNAMEDFFVAKDKEAPKFAETSYTVEEVDVADFEITFNEPVVFSTLSTPAEFYLNGTNITAHVNYVTPFAAAGAPTVEELSSVIVDLSAGGANMELEENNNIFEVVGLQDLAGNTTVPARITTKIEVEKEDVTATAPKVVEIKQVHDGAFLVVFDKPIVDGTDIITIKNLKNTNQDAIYDVTAAGAATIATLGGANGVAVSDPGYYTAPAGTTNTAYYVEFVNVPADTTVYKGGNQIIRDVVVENHKVTVGSTDYKGTKDTRTEIFTKDNKAPTVLGWEIDTTGANHDVVVEFNDDLFDGAVVDGLGAIDNLVVKYVEDGVTYTYDNIVAPTGVAANKLSLGLLATESAPGANDHQPKLFDGATLKPGITFTVKLPYGLVADDHALNATSDTPQYNGPFVFIGDTITVTTPGTSTGETVPQTGQSQVSWNTTVEAIEVKFVGEDLRASTITDLSNYTFDGAALHQDTVIEYTLDDTKAANDPDRNIAFIYLAPNTVVRNGNYNLTIKNVKTTGGATMLPTAVKVYGVPDNTQPVMTNAKITSDNTVEVTFDETLATLGTNPERNFFVLINGVKFNAATVTTKGSSTRTLVVTTADTFDYNLNVKVQIVKDASNDMFVKDVAGNEAKEVTITPTIDIQ